MPIDTSNMTKAQLEAAVKALEAAQPAPRKITVKLSDATGSIVVSGLSGRFPTTLYRSSWKRLLTKEVASLILSFIQENEDETTRHQAPGTGDTQQWVSSFLSYGIYPPPPYVPPIGIYLGTYRYIAWEQIPYGLTIQPHAIPYYKVYYYPI